MRRLVSILACTGVALGVVACVATTGESSGRASAASASARTPELKDTEWPGHGRDSAETRYSPLKQINADNVDELGVAWVGEMIEKGQWQSTPVMVNGIVVVTTPWSYAYAFDAKTGKQLWKYNPQVPRELAATALCCNNSNRGVTYWNGKVIWGTLDGRLVAVELKTGKLVWEAQTTNPEDPMSITGAPRVGNGVVFMGQAGGEYHQRGYMTGWNADTGEFLWKFFLVPGNPANGPDGAASDPVMAMAAETWKGEWWKYGGGATVWDGMVYDEVNDLIIVGTGNGAPWPAEVRSPGGGDNLFTASIVALHGKTGKYAWHYQTTPMESFDFDNTSPLTIAELMIEGQKKRVVMQLPKNGLFYVIESATGKVINARLAVPFANWLTGFDKENNWKPILNPEANYGATGKGWYVIPFQTHVWAPQAFNPETGLMYVPVRYATYGMVAEAGAMMGNQMLSIVVGGRQPEVPRPNPAPSGQWLTAWDPVTQKEVWRSTEAGTAGTMTTAGNLVIQGRGSNLLAFRADTGGEPLWNGAVGAAVSAGAITYQIDGEQYVAVVGGGGTGGRVVAYKLGGSAALPPAPPTAPQVLNPPPNFGTDAQLALGSEKFAQNCSICHDNQSARMANAPDLRYSPFLGSAEAFKAVVIDGVKTESGMVSYAKSLSLADAEAIRAHLTSTANTLKDNPPPARGGFGGFGGGGGGGPRGGGPPPAPPANAAPAVGLHQ